MKWDIDKPCATCPYRRETKRALWHRSEFQNLQAQDHDELNGHVFGCHSFCKEPREEHRPCIGWLLDQKKRNAPSIQLRLVLMGNREAAALYNRVTRRGLDLYNSIDEMVRANYPTRANHKRRSPSTK